MKVLMVTPFYFEPPHAKIGLKRLCEDLARNGIEVFVVSSHVLNSKKREVLNGVRIFRQKSVLFNSIPYVIPLDFKLIDTIVNQYDIDIIHAHTTQFITSIIALEKAKKWGKPFVVTIHGMNITSGNRLIDLLSQIYDLTLARRLIRSSDRIIVLSKELINRALELNAIQKKIVVIPNGFYQIPKQNALDRNNFGLSENDFVIGFVGRLSKIKGIESLVDVGIKLSKLLPNFKMIIAGDGPLMNKLKAKIKNYDVNNIIFLGYINNAFKIMQCFDLLILPSYSEGLSTTLLEALFQSIPVMTTKVGAANDIIQHNINGILIKDNENHTLESNILNIYHNNELLKTIKNNAYNAVKDVYDQKITTNKIINEYIKLKELK